MDLCARVRSDQFIFLSPDIRLVANCYLQSHRDCDLSIVDIVTTLTSEAQPFLVSMIQFCVLSPSKEDGNTETALSARLTTALALQRAYCIGQLMCICMFPESKANEFLPILGMF